MFEIEFLDIPISARDNWFLTFPDTKLMGDELANSYNASRDYRLGNLYYVFENEADYMFWLLKYL